jgi:aspartate/methionine/tyrosine aminotransferase
MAERTCAVNAMSKTYSVTGWRVGWVVAPAELTAAIRKVHDFLTVGAAAPLQQAGVTAMGLDDDYFAGLASFYQARRDFLCGVLAQVGLEPIVPSGAYYTMADCSPFAGSDVDFAKRLITEVGVAVVPGSSFFREPELGSGWVRFAFCKEMATLEAAAQRLAEVATW